MLKGFASIPSQTTETVRIAGTGAHLDRTRSGERALLVHVLFDSVAQMAVEDEVEEIRSLAETAGAEVVGVLVVQRLRPDARLFIGSGKAQEIKARIPLEEIDLVVFNHELSASQERNLERLLECRVLDRSGLILDIFASRARTHEGKLQVELAQLEHIATRLVRGRTYLGRQKGGIGLRGPGEMQLETDRRLLGVRIKQLKQRLEKVRRQRANSREARLKRERPLVALVGYTNAGKSTLFNTLTTAKVYVADQLFATLDPTLRRLELPDVRHALIADTVGFINNLPHELIASFRATLEETRQADLLLHVVDASDELRDMRIEQVNQVLKEIGADHLPQLLIYNKIDKLEKSATVDIDEESGLGERVWLSAVTGDGVEALLQEINLRLRAGQRQGWAKVPVEQGGLRAALYEHARVLNECSTEEGDCWMEISISDRDLARLSARFKIALTLAESPPQSTHK